MEAAMEYGPRRAGSADPAYSARNDPISFQATHHDGIISLMDRDEEQQTMLSLHNGTDQK